jgi:hypothetical protein
MKVRPVRNAMFNEIFYRTHVFFRQLFNPKYLTKAQIVEDILLSLTDADRIMLKYTPKDHLIRYHHTFGTYIRNTYKLWDKEYPYLEGKHPDDYSFEIITDIWTRIQEL